MCVCSKTHFYLHGERLNFPHNSLLRSKQVTCFTQWFFIFFFQKQNTITIFFFDLCLWPIWPCSKRQGEQALGEFNRWKKHQCWITGLCLTHSGIRIRSLVASPLQQSYKMKCFQLPLVKWGGHCALTGRYLWCKATGLPPATLVVQQQDHAKHRSHQKQAEFSGPRVKLILGSEKQKGNSILFPTDSQCCTI